MRLAYRDYRKHKKAVWRRIRENSSDTIIVRWIRRRDVERWLEYGLIDPPEITPALWNELRAIPHARGTPRCAAAELDDGTIEECVIFIENAEVATWNLFDIPSRRLVPAVRLRRIFPSPRKLPVSVEQKMNMHGETHMGGMLVNFVLGDGTKFGHTSGSASSAFVTAPEGYVPDDIVDVEFTKDPGVVQSTPTLDGPDWKHCAFRIASGAREKE